MSKVETIDVTVADVTGQKVVNVEAVESDARVAELVESMLFRMGLPDTDSEGRPLVYHGLLPREGRHLNGAERVGDALETGDRVVLHPNIDAGGN